MIKKLKGLWSILYYLYCNILIDFLFNYIKNGIFKGVCKEESNKIFKKGF